MGADKTGSLVIFFNKSYLNSITDLSNKQQVLNELVINASSIFVKLSYAFLFLIAITISFQIESHLKVCPYTEA